ncbi:MAG TPA: hypothetical protein VIQ31_04450, partial [Phormidium sp.]
MNYFADDVKGKKYISESSFLFSSLREFHEWWMATCLYKYCVKPLPKRLFCNRNDASARVEVMSGEI